MQSIRLPARLLALALGAVALAGCGQSTTDRALSGGGIGAAVGAAGAAASGGDLAKGAVVGGAAGAAVGVLTDSDDIDLNRKRRRR